MIMRPLSLLPSACLLLLASGTGAQTLPYPQPDDPSMSTVQVTASPKPIRVRDVQAEKIGGSYAMSNGWYLRVRTGSRHIDATIDNQPPLRLLAVAPYKFASPGGRVTMEFNRGNEGDDMLMSYMPDPRLAQVVVISSAPIAQR
jgi:hypothetical protein